MKDTDYAISSKPLLISNKNNLKSTDPSIYELKNWNLVFTRLGKYFFYNDQSFERCWIPSRRIIELLKRSIGPAKFEMFFDPFYIEEEEELDCLDSSDSGDSLEKCEIKDNADKNNAEDEFKVYLLKNNIDPFAPWPTILASHSNSPQFLAIPSDRRRQDLFSQICPLLIEEKREICRRKLEDAKDWWNGVKEENWRGGVSWFQVLKKVKGNFKFSILNEKECEKEYKNKKK